MKFDIWGWPWPNIQRPIEPGGKPGDRIEVKDLNGITVWTGVIREIDPDGTVRVMDIDHGQVMTPDSVPPAADPTIY